MGTTGGLGLGGLSVRRDLNFRDNLMILLQMLYTAISRKVVGKSACDNPGRHCGWF